MIISRKSFSRRLPGAALIVALLSGCAGSVPDGSGTSASSSAVAATATRLTTEELAGFTPDQLCALVGPARESIGLHSAGLPGLNPVGNPECRWRTSQVSLIVTMLADGFNIDQIPVVPDTRATTTTIEARRARVLTAPADPTAGCNIYVELTPTAYLSVSMLVLTAGEGRIDECALAIDIATIATTTLTTGRPR